MLQKFLVANLQAIVNVILPLLLLTIVQFRPIIFLPRCEVLAKHKVQQLNTLKDISEDEVLSHNAEILAKKVSIVSENVLLLTVRYELNHFVAYKKFYLFINLGSVLLLGKAKGTSTGAKTC